MSRCAIQDDGAIELYFYDELEPAEHARIGEHVRRCAECAEALRELTVIRAALAARPDVSAPPSGDWTSFMQRLDEAVLPRATGSVVVPFGRPAAVGRRPLVTILATAALLTLVALSVFMASRAGRSLSQEPAAQRQAANAQPRPDGAPLTSGLASVSLQHLERSKLVVLGLATREPNERSADWAYERELATALLNDTRLYRMAAEERGLTSLAGVMKDLELVLLQTSMAESTDTAALPQIQRLIQKRGLVQKMDVAGTTGLLP